MSESAVTAEAAEQRRSADIERLITDTGVVRGAHGLVWVRGADAVTFLDAIISQAIEGAEPGSVRRSLLLTPQGKMRAFLWVLRSSPDEVGLVTQSSTVDTVVEDLTRFRFRVDAEIEVENRPVVTLVGAQADDALVAADLPRPASGWLATQDGLVAAVAFPGAAILRYVLVGDAAAAIGQSAAEAVAEAYEAVRISVGEPLGNVDFDDSTIAHELGPVEDAVDFTKGCYLGQELIARIDSRGRVTKKLRQVVGEKDLTGAELQSDGATVGSVASSAQMPDGTYLGLALIRHQIEPGDTIEATTPSAAFQATVRAVPDT